MNLVKNSKSILVYAACLMLAFAMPMTAYAEEPTTEQETTAPIVAQPVAPEPAAPVAPAPATPVAPSQPAPASPKEPKTGAQPKETYEYDAATKKWNSNKWQWDASQGKYVPVKTQAVAPQQTVGGSTNGTSSSTSTNTAAVANALDALAVSGNASVKGNTFGGSAISGNASSSATIINNINSSMSNASNKEAATFVKDVVGDVNGDIMLQPMLLKAMLEANAAQSSGSQVVNSTSKSGISNDLNLTAVSGNSSVSGNTKAGDATSGSANTVVDVVNIVNSMVAANQSFMGTVNIYGNLNGDILIAPDFIPQMLASNGGSTSGGTSTKVNSRDTQEIVNNVSLAAESGAALVKNNTAAGNATSGDANTNLVIFNLSGHEIVASNSMLVFINVLGSWVGVIVDAPQGATSAAIGDNVTKNNISPDLSINTSTDAVITNNITLDSKSGDATVAGNTQGGNATSGNATASANIANITNSSLGLTGWFGVLFINVFGSWNGSFGVDTAAGNAVTQSPGILGAQPQAQQFMRFTPTEQAKTKAAVQRLKIVDPVVNNNDSQSSPVQTASTQSVKGISDESTTDIPTQQSIIDGRKDFNAPVAALSLLLIVGSGFALRRYLF